MAGVVTVCAMVALLDSFEVMSYGGVSKEVSRIELASFLLPNPKNKNHPAGAAEELEELRECSCITAASSFDHHVFSKKKNGKSC